jgi:hypothetical protein
MEYESHGIKDASFVEKAPAAHDCSCNNDQGSKLLVEILVVAVGYGHY